MHASAKRQQVHGRFRRLVDAICRLAGINPRRCFCMRCIAAQSGAYRRTRVTVGRRAYVDIHVLGIRISRRYAFDLPSVSPPSVASAAGNAMDVGDGIRRPARAAFKEQDRAFADREAVRSRHPVAASI